MNEKMSIRSTDVMFFLGVLLLTPVLIYPLLNSFAGLLLFEAIFCAAVGLIIWSERMTGKNLKIKRFVLLWWFSLLPILLNSDAIKQRQFGFSICWISCLMFMTALTQYEKVQLDKLVLTVGAVCSIYVVSTILFNLNILNGILIQIAEVFRPKIDVGDLKTAGFTSHYSHNGMYIALAGVAWYATAAETKRKKYALMLLLSVVAMLYTQKRGPLVAMVAAILMAAVLGDPRSYGKRLVNMLLSAIVLCIGVYIAYLLFPSLFSVLDRFTNTEDPLNNRSYLWDYAFELFFSKPLMGWGWGYYANHLNVVVDTVTVSQLNAHNIYIQLLADTGALGLLLFLSMMSFSLFVCVNLNKQKNEDESIRVSLRFSLAMQLFFLIYGLTGNPLYDKQMFIPYLIAVSITIYYSHLYRRNHGVKRFSWSTPAYK